MELIDKIKDYLSANAHNVDIRPILPPSRQLAQIMSGFANSGGGYIVLGADYVEKKGLEVNGLPADFNVIPITQKAQGLLKPTPDIRYGYYNWDNVQLFVIEVQPSAEKVALEEKAYTRKDKTTVELNKQAVSFRPGGYRPILSASNTLKEYLQVTTDAKSQFIDHYQGTLKIIDNLPELLYPAGADTPSPLKEGSILTRILFSSIVDNFELYLSNLLYEIWLAKPETLRSDKKQVSLEDVLKCNDMEEFIQSYAKSLIAKMQKGSVKGFISENALIRNLHIFSVDDRENKVEAILQIRHLFAHRNGIIDEKFLTNYPAARGLDIGSYFSLSIDGLLEKLLFLAEVVDLTDRAAIDKYKLAAL
ncbi:AlbA family DNA-binding domain-containing protein [Chitinophaga sp. RAB17]|uniref:AlbA family DNA-binding domain-containing protein n=1 Tax=Chitinophaga sp. RAB17 TaxID=3233049 RepID=UPI003F8F1FAD